MRVLHLVPHFDNSGNGVVNATVDLACEQARLGMTVTLIGVGDGSFRNLLQRAGVTVYSLPGTSPRNFFLFFVRLFKLLRASNPEIVHAHTVPGVIIAHLFRACFRYKLITSVHSSGRRGARLMSVGDLVICVSDHLASEMRDRGIPPQKIRVVRNGPSDHRACRREEIPAVT